jgi:glycosyltransferase involved in cell wall biosynthesis
MTMTLANRRVLYISYNGMLDPLGQSQVIPYLKELSRAGVRFTLLSFEGPKAYTSEGRERCERLRAELASGEIDWHFLRYHKRPSLPATSYDVLAGIRYGSRLVQSKQIEMVHARSHIPATIALRLKRRFGLRMIFDVRGLMAEEYVDADHWKKGSVPYRLTKAMESASLQASDGVVTLTEKIWPAIKDWKGLRGRDVIHEVVPCCTDLELFRFSQSDRERVRAELDLQDRFVLVYSGSIGGWYLTDKTADFFVALLKREPQGHFLWLTGGSKSLIEKLMSDRAVNSNQFTVLNVAPAEVTSYLSASDVGIAFYKPTFSRLATSPVKVSEYLACGLPVIVNAGVGDSDTFVESQTVGAVINDFNEGEYKQTLVTIENLLAGDVRERARTVAESFFDVRRTGLERYARLYERVFDLPN